MTDMTLAGVARRCVVLTLLSLVGLVIGLAFVGDEHLSVWAWCWMCVLLLGSVLTGPVGGGGLLLLRRLHFAPFAQLIVTFIRLLLRRGLRQPGELTGLVFPVQVADLTGPGGAKLLTAMLRYGQHLPEGAVVASVRDRGAEIKDGVKGDKAILDVTYDGTAGSLPTSFFAKFNLQTPLPVRLLVETSSVCRCEALFYHLLAGKISEVMPAPKCYFVDYSAQTGEFVLLTELVAFGEGDVLPLKHRIRDEPCLAEQRLFVAAGARLNAMLWGGRNPLLAGVPRKSEACSQMWAMSQGIGLVGLRHTMQGKLGGRRINEAWMTWRPPAGLLGREWELIRDMPAILTSLCEEEDLVAYGHNDLVTDNAFFRRAAGSESIALGGVFDWQQGCVNSVGQEWAWNLHFLSPEFLDAHEAELLDLVLQTYAERGVKVRRERFMNAYVLGTVQMFVFSGGSLQLLMADLHKQGLFESLRPDDDCTRQPGGLDKATLGKLVGAEMSRRAFTNCCNIMRRHSFASAWASWQNEQLPGGQRHRV